MKIQLVQKPTGLWSNGMERFYPPRQGLKFEYCLERYGFPPACVKGRVPMPLPSGLNPTWLCGLATPSGLGAIYSHNSRSKKKEKKEKKLV